MCTEALTACHQGSLASLKMIMLLCLTDGFTGNAMNEDYHDESKPNGHSELK